MAESIRDKGFFRFLSNRFLLAVLKFRFKDWKDGGGFWNLDYSLVFTKSKEKR